MWAKVPEGYTSVEFTSRLLEDTSIVVTPGSSYGRYGEGYIRLSLTTPDEPVFSSRWDTLLVPGMGTKKSPW